MHKAVAWFPLAGLYLSAVLLTPFAVFSLYENYPSIQAVLYAAAYAWLTRALHHDGLGDMCDAFGSGTQGDSFYRVLTDSRIGAFGVVGICLFLVAQIVLVEHMFSARLYALLLLTPVLSRSLVLVFAGVAPVNSRSTLGRLTAAAPKKQAATIALCGCLLYSLYFFSVPQTLCCAALNGAVCFLLLRLSFKADGYNGDFLGSCILLSELTTPLGFFLAL